LTSCQLVNVSPDSEGDNCYSPNLAAGFTVGTSYTTTTTGDASSTGDDGSNGDNAGTSTATTSTTGPAGISEISTQFEVPSGEIDDVTQTSLTLDGLTNGIKYVVVVTSVDGSGNFGPASTPVCNMPSPVSDFYSTFRQANGGAPSGSCALEGAGIPVHAPAFAVAFVGALAAWLRRRRMR
jgi:hypothetical protein